MMAVAGIMIGRWYTSRHIVKYTREQADEKVKGGNAIYLYVRSAQERSATSIKGSLHIPLQDLSNRVDELKKHQKKEIITFCRTGTRSLAAADILIKAGYQSANLSGGIGIRS